MDISLVMFKSDGSRRDFPLHKPRTVVGRKRSCDLRIPLTSVSRQHCEIVLEDTGVAKLRDLGSSNGTYHNSSRVQEQSLSAGDEIVIGPVVFIVVIDGVPDEISPVRTIVDSDTADSHGSVAVARAEPTPEGDPTEELDEEPHTPTVDLDDPIATLEAMADAESGDASDAKSDSDSDSESESDPDAGEEDDDFDIELLAVDDEDDKPAP